MNRLLFILMLFFANTPLLANVPANQIHALLKKPVPSITRADKLLSALHQHYRFVVFFKSTCPHCHRFIPVLEDFAHNFGIAILGISVDGPDLDGLKSRKMTADDYKDYFLEAGFKAIVPALYLENTDTQQVYPVLFGEAAPYQLAERMAALTKHIEEAQHAAR